MVWTLRYIEIFKDAVFDAIHGDDYLKTRNDLPKLWERVTGALTQNRFPTLNARLYPHILEKYLPGDANFIYSKFDRECTLDWASKQDNIVAWTEKIDVILIPRSPDEKIIYKYSSKTDSRTPRDLATIEIVSLRINGKYKDAPGQKEYKEMLQEKKYPDELGGIGLHSYYDIPLELAPEYHIVRVLKRRICLPKDPAMEYTSPAFIEAKTVKVQCIPADLRAVFVSLDSDQFKDEHIPGEVWSIHRKLTGPLIRNQGYMIFLQRV